MNFFRTLSMVYVFVFQNTGEATEISVDQNTIVCGKNLTLSCKNEKYKSHLSWIFEKDVIPVANCVDNSCSVNPSYADKYQITHDLDQGILNLTIIKLTKNYIGRKFVCSNGFDYVSEIIALRDYKALLIENTKREEVTATSGCNPHGMTVKTKWFKINAKSKEESDFCPKIQHSNTTKCLNVSLCGNDQQIQHFEVIDAKSSNKGKYFLKAAVTYGNKITKSQISALKYYLKEQDYNECDDLDDWKFNSMACLFLILLCVVCVAAGVAFWFAFKRRASKGDRNGDKNRDGNVNEIRDRVYKLSQELPRVHRTRAYSIKNENGTNMKTMNRKRNGSSLTNDSGCESMFKSYNSLHPALSINSDIGTYHTNRNPYKTRESSSTNKLGSSMIEMSTNQHQKNSLLR